MEPFRNSCPFVSIRGFLLPLYLAALLAHPAQADDEHQIDEQLLAEANALAPEFEAPQMDAPAPHQLSLQGQWGSVIPWTPHIPVTAATLPDGRLLTFSSNQRTTFPSGVEFTYAAVWNPSTGAFTEINNNRHDMFCGGTVMLPDGRVLINGGRNTTRLGSIFDWRTNQWSAIPNMNDGRWYNTSVALADGSVFTVTGDGGRNTAERWTASAGWARLSGINWSGVVSQPGYVSNWHPLVLVAPDGRLFHGGPTRQMNWVTATGTGSRTYAGVDVPGALYPKEGCFAMYDEGRILVAGGSSTTTANSFDSSTGTSTNAAFTIDIRTGAPVVQMTASMAHARQFVNSVILPNGEVIAIGGNTSGRKFNDTGSILVPEIWNPQTGQWRAVAAMSVPRNYHSLALLLPNGRVWSGGGGLSGNSADHRDAQIYTPPQLFAPDGAPAVRPVISEKPAYIAPGSVFSVTASIGVARFSFIKMSSQTHSVNTDLRFLNVPFTETAPGSYALTAHSNVNVLTPGYWMLFALDAQDAWSEAAIVLVDPDLTATIINPGAQINAVGVPASLTVSGHAPGDASLIFSATGLPTGLSISAQGVISGTPAQAGEFTVTVSVTDGSTSASTDFLWTITPPNLYQNIADFTGTDALLQINGVAALNGPVLRLTPNAGGQAGAAFLKSALPVPANTSFITRFVFRMSGTADGADGMAFVVQGDRATALGNSGSGIGYEGVLKSLAVEFDTYAGSGDPNGNHVGVLTNGNVTSHLVTHTPAFDLEDGNSHTAWVEYDGVADTLRVFLAQGVVSARPDNPVITRAGLDLAALTGGVAWVGFTAGTGGLANNHDVLAWEFNSNAHTLPQPPVLTNPGDQTGVVGMPLSLPVQATDANLDTLSHSATNLPAGLSINASTGVISGTPAIAGASNVTVTVSDGNTAPVSAAFTWLINPGLELQPVTTQPAPAGSSVAYTAQSTGGANPRYKWSFGDGTIETAFSANPAVTHSFANPGRYLVTLTAADDTGRVVTRDFWQNIHAPLTAARPAVSSAIAYEPRATGNARVWVVNPDNDSVTVLDAVTRAKLAETPVGKGPRSLAVAPDGRVWVANVEDAALSILDSGTFAVAQTIALARGSRPFGLAFAPDGSAAFVACEGAGLLLKLHPTTGAQTGSVNVGAHARHVSVAADSARVYVSRFITPPLPGENTASPQTTGRGGEVIVLNTSAMTVERTLLLAHSEAADSPTSARGIPNYLGAPALSPDGLSAWVPSKQDNIRRGLFREGSQLNHDQSVRAIASRLNLATQTEDLPARVDFDDAGMPSAAVFDPFGNLLFVALESNRAVAVVDAWSNEELLRFETGRAPQGLALSPDGRTLFVQNFMSRSVTVHDVAGLLAGSSATPVLLGTASTVTTEALPAQILLGKQHFYDAADTRLALQNYISCAACHNDGGHDGRVWDLTGFGEGLRNTITLRGHGRHGALHWSGNFDEVHDFEGQIRGLAGGTGLMTDAQFNTGTRNLPLGDPKAGVSADLDALAAYVTSLASESKSPHRASNGALTAQGAEGEKIFRRENCASCHAGENFTLSALGVFRDVGTLKPSSGQRLGGALTGLDVPTLRGVWATAPYLHDGSAPTLAAAVSAHSGVTLSTADMDALVAYLNQIDDQPASAPVPVTVMLESAAPAPVSGPFTVTATFSHAVTGFTLSDITVTGGTASALTGSGTSWSFTITPGADVSVSLAANIAQDAAGLGNAASNVLERAYGAPAPVLISEDIGNARAPGVTAHDGASGAYTLTADGEDIFFNADGFHFAKVLLTGDGEIRARVRSLDNTHPWAKAGVMIRESSAAGSRHATAFITPPAAGNGFGMVTRSIANGATTYAGGPALNAVPDNWVRLVRSGNVITGYASANGSAWTQISAVTLTSLAAQVQVGLVLTSSDISQRATAVFDSVEILGSQAVSAPEAVLSAASAIETGAFTVQAQFSQPVTGLELADFIVTNGAASNLTGSGAAYAVTITPQSAGLVTVALPAGAVLNAASVPGTASNTVTVNYAPPVAATLQGQDVGDVGAAGSTSYDGAVYTVRGSGEDIFFNADGFHFALTQLSGDGEIRARVTSQTNQNPWGKAGVMFRETLAAGSRHVMMFTTPTGAGNGFGMVARAAANGATAYTGGPALNAAPNNWVRLVRSGATLTAFASANGTAWTVVGTATLSGLPSNVYVGLAQSSGVRAQLGTATFDNVQVVGAQSVVAPAVTLSSASSVETGPFVAHAQFSQSVSGLTLADFLVSNGSATNLTGSGALYSLTITPAAEGAVTVQLPANAAQNSAGAGSTASNVLSVSYVPPAVISLAGQDVGAVAVAGSTIFDGSTGQYTMTGAGEDIFFTADGFQFASTTLTGDGEIRARVTSQTNQNPWAKAGVMFREQLTGASRHVMMFTTPMGAGNGFGMVWRAATGAAANYGAGPALNAAPDNWVRLVRAGDSFTTYASANGTAWTLVGNVTLTGMPATLHAGLALTSGSTYQLSTATFDNVQIVSTGAGGSGSSGSGSSGSGSTPGSSNNKDTDFDGDDVNDLIEYAIGSGTRYDAGLSLVSDAAGRVDAVLDVLGQAAGVSFTLEASPDLTGWVPLPLEPVAHDVESGRRQLVWSGISHLNGQSPARGIVRLRVTHTSGATATSTPQAWVRHDLTAGTQSVGLSLVRAPVYAGFISSLGAEGALLLDGPLGAAVDAESEYYMEVRDGALAGHRLELSHLEEGRAVADTAHTRGTLDHLPAELAGARVVIRPHCTLGRVFDRHLLTGGTASARADQVIFHDGSGWRTYWLLKQGARHQWALVGDASVADQGRLVIAPGTGVMFKARAPAAFTLTGHVRQNAFLRALGEGHNLLSPPWPLAATPRRLRFTTANAFTAGPNADTADQLQLWKGDLTPGTEGYDIHWLQNTGAQGAWISPEGADVSESLVLPAHRAFFLRARPATAAQGWWCPVP